MEELENKLMDSINQLSNLELLEYKIEFAKFNKEVIDCYESKINAIESNIDYQIKFYGKNPETYREQKNSILEKYKEEFQKVYNKRREQFFSILMEIQEINANQKIALVNFNKTVKSRKKFFEGATYKEYVEKYESFKHIVDTTLKHDEFEKYSKLLEKHTDPSKMYDIKLEALINKYAGYDEIIVECTKKLNECVEAVKEDFENISKFRNESLAISKKENIFTKLINKILARIAGSSKFEKDVIQKMEKELTEIGKDNDNTINIINEQTINLVAMIEKVREELNSEFKLATE